jgi:membrane fusion protein (multidrug efflux system)
MTSIELKHQTIEGPQEVSPAEAPQAAASQTARHSSPPADQPHPFIPVPLESPGASAKPAAEAPSSRSRIVFLIAALLLVVGLTLGFIPRWRQRRLAIADSAQLVIPTVSVVSPVAGKVADGLVLPAEIKPWLEASIYARANGYLKNWIADIGAHVEAGQLLALIETPDLDQQLEQARAELVLAQANLHLAQTTDERWKMLLKTASVSEQEAAEKAAARETAAASVEASRANVRRLEQLVSFQRVVAPFAGTVTICAVDVGDLIVAGSGGSQLFHLAQTDKLRVYVRVPEPDALGIAPGQAATLTTPESPGREFAAKVVTTSEAISVASRTLLTELEVDNSKHQVLPYSYGEVHFNENQANTGLALPSNALLFRAAGLQVAVVQPDDTIALRKVQVGRDFGQTIEILAGVTPTDRVVASPTDSLLAGTKVRIAETQNSAKAK